MFILIVIIFLLSIFVYQIRNDHTKNIEIMIIPNNVNEFEVPTNFNGNVVSCGFVTNVTEDMIWYRISERTYVRNFNFPRSKE